MYKNCHFAAVTLDSLFVFLSVRIHLSRESARSRDTGRVRASGRPRPIARADCGGTAAGRPKPIAPLRRANYPQPDKQARETGDRQTSRLAAFYHRD